MILQKGKFSNTPENKYYRLKSWYIKILQNMMLSLVAFVFKYIDKSKNGLSGIILKALPHKDEVSFQACLS